LWADEIGERSVCVVRNEGARLPLALGPGAKVATVTLTMTEDTRGYVKELDVVNEELASRGFEVEHFVNPGSELLNRRAGEFDAVFINVHIMPVYGTTRFAGKAVSTLWNSFWHDHPAVVFTSFGDPYKLYEMPYVPNYVMTFSNTPSSQRTVVKVWLGEIEPAGKLPVSLEGYYECEVGAVSGSRGGGPAATAGL
jgi:beta-N-acetylhexosaminidase